MGSYTFGASVMQGQRMPRPDPRDDLMKARFGSRRRQYRQPRSPDLWRRRFCYFRAWPAGGGGSFGSPGDMVRARYASTRRRAGGTVRLPYSILRTIKTSGGVPVPDARCMLFLAGDNTPLREARTLLDGTVELRVETNTVLHRMVVQTNDGRTGATLDTVTGA